VVSIRMWVVLVVLEWSLVVNAVALQTVVVDKTLNSDGEFWYKI